MFRMHGEEKVFREFRCFGGRHDTVPAEYGMHRVDIQGCTRWSSDFHRHKALSEASVGSIVAVLDAVVGGVRFVLENFV